MNDDVAWENSQYFETHWFPCLRIERGNSPWLRFWLVENLLQPIRINNQIWVVTCHQYGISALAPKASSLGNHWCPRKTWWCRLFSQAMIDVFLSLNELSVIWIGLTSKSQDWKVKKKSFIFLSKGEEKQMRISRNLKNKGETVLRLKTEPVLLIHLNSFQYLYWRFSWRSRLK